MREKQAMNVSKKQIEMHEGFVRPALLNFRCKKGVTSSKKMPTAPEKFGRFRHFRRFS
jgi:hypothetical protein